MAAGGGDFINDSADTPPRSVRSIADDQAPFPPKRRATAETQVRREGPRRLRSKRRRAPQR